MRIEAAPRPLPADDDAIRAAVADAEVPPLLAAVAVLTGDLSLLRDDMRPDPNRMLEPDAGIEPDKQQEARELAADALIRFRDSGQTRAPLPTGDDLHRV